MLDIFRKQEQRLMGGAAESTPSADLDGQLEDDASPQPPPDLDMSSYLLAVSIASLFASFSDATLSKTDELADTVTEKPKVKWKAVQDQKTCDRLPDGSEGCGSRNGTIYETDDPELQVHMPGSGTHPYCRCYLEVVI
jgi:phosphomannomutase